MKNPQYNGTEYLLVDGYNVIFAWEHLKELTERSLDGARQVLINILCNYQGYSKCNLILVFDAYRVKGQYREVETVNGISIVYTKEAETADMYIEKVSHKLAKTTECVLSLLTHLSNDNSRKRRIACILTRFS